MKFNTWITDLLAMIFILGGLGAGAYAMYRMGYIDAKNPITSCDVADVYGYHDTDDKVTITTCPDKRQKLIIAREGLRAGSYEYRCHCQ
jgi:hypothetical protein